MSMFCYQCEQTARGTGCTAHGVCGKDLETAALQDLAIHIAEGVSQYAHRARPLGVTHRPADLFVVEALFATVTNVDFDPQRLAELIRRGAAVRTEIRRAYETACQKAGQQPQPLAHDAAIEPSGDLNEMIRQGEQVTIHKRIEALGDDVAGLQELITYGRKAWRLTLTTR